MRKSFSSTPITYNGQTKSLAQWAMDLGVPYPTVRMRYTRGVRDPEVLLSNSRGYVMTGQAGYRLTRITSRSPDSFLEDWFRPEVLDVLRARAAEAHVGSVQLIMDIVSKWADENKLTGVNTETDHDN